MRFNLLKIAKEEEATEQWNFFSFSSSIYILERERVWSGIFISRLIEAECLY